MPLIGSSGAAKKSKGNLLEYQDWGMDQFKRGTEKSQTAYDRGRAGYNQYAQGVQDMQDAGTGFLNQPYENWNTEMQKQRGGWANTAAQNTANVGEYKGAIDKAYQDNMQFADTMSGRNDQVFRDNMQNIGNVHDILKKENWSNYDRMMKANDAMYGGLRSDAKGVYAGEGQRADYLKPASEAAQSMVARTYSPQMASTIARLQQAGLRPGDPQYEAAMSRVESQRARGMDDDLAKRTSEWVNTRNTIDTQGLNTDLGLAQTGAGITRGLNETQLNNSRDLGMSHLNQMVNQETQWGNAANASDMNRQNISNQRAQDYNNWSNKANQTNTQNFQVDAEIGRDIANGNVEQAMNKFGIQMKLLQQQGDVAKQEMMYAQMWDQIARAHGEDMANQAMKMYQMESQNSNLLAKFGAGVAGSALSAFATGGMGALGGKMFGGGKNAGDAKYGG